MIIILSTPSFEGGNEDHLTNVLKNNIVSNGQRIVVLPQSKPIAAKRQSGLFYDIDTWMLHQSTLVAQVIQTINNNRHTTNEFHIVAADWWCPGIEQIALYTRLENIPCKYYGWLHGATWVTGDLMNGAAIRSISKGLEAAWKNIYDVTWYTSKFFLKGSTGIKNPQRLVEEFDPKPWQQMDISDARPFSFAVAVIGRPTKDRQFEKTISILNKTNLSYCVISPTPVDNTRGRIKGRIFDTYLDDNQMGEILSQCKTVFSMAKQEGWGFGIMKAVASGCEPILIDDAVYPELYPNKWLFDKNMTNREVALYVQDRVKNSYKNVDKSTIKKWALENLTFKVGPIHLEKINGKVH